MRALTIADSADIALGLQDEIRRSEESRYDHRLHGVLLVAQGVTCPQVARLLGDSRRTVEYRVHHFEARGLAGLREGERPARPSRLNDPQLKLVSACAYRKSQPSQKATEHPPPGVAGLSGIRSSGRRHGLVRNPPCMATPPHRSSGSRGGQQPVAAHAAQRTQAPLRFSRRPALVAVV